MKKPIRIRQGDVFFTRISKLPAGERKERKNGVLAYGEVTGHAHAVAAQDRDSATVFECGGGLYIAVTGDAISIGHEEHATVTLPRGNYQVEIQREYSPEAIRNVED